MPASSHDDETPTAGVGGLKHLNPTAHPEVRAAIERHDKYRQKCQRLREGLESLGERIGNSRGHSLPDDFPHRGLLDRAGITTIEAAFSALPSTLESIDGIGVGRSQKIRDEAGSLYRDLCDGGDLNSGEAVRGFNRKMRDLRRSQALLREAEGRLGDLLVEKSAEIKERVKPAMRRIIEEWLEAVERAAVLQQKLRTLRRPVSDFNEQARNLPRWPETAISPLPPLVELSDLNPQKVRNIQRKVNACGFDWTPNL